MLQHPQHLQHYVDTPLPEKVMLPLNWAKTTKTALTALTAPCTGRLEILEGWDRAGRGRRGGGRGLGDLQNLQLCGSPTHARTTETQRTALLWLGYVIAYSSSAHRLV